jgi:hypothetical protein
LSGSANISWNDALRSVGQLNPATGLHLGEEELPQMIGHLVKGDRHMLKGAAREGLLDLLGDGAGFLSAHAVEADTT